MLTTDQIFSLFKHIFRSPNYGETLEKYIVRGNPKCPGDVERLERQWQRGQYHDVQRGQWL